MINECIINYNQYSTTKDDEKEEKNAKRKIGFHKKGAVLKMLTSLKQIVDHPAVFLKTGAHERSTNLLAQQPAEVLGHRLQRVLFFVLALGGPAQVREQHDARARFRDVE